MKPATRLPRNYVARGRLDPSTSTPLGFGLSIGSAAFFVAFGSFFVWAARLDVPDPGEGRVVLSVGGALAALLGATAIIVLVAVLHELTHGAVFWLLTGERPRFGVHHFLAYVGCPRRYIPRSSYLVVELAPFFVLTVIGLVLLAVIPSSLAAGLVLALTLNAAGAVGDLYVVILLLPAPPTSLVNDLGERVLWYGPTQPD